jgi:hypothetical protein
MPYFRLNQRLLKMLVPPELAIYALPEGSGWRRFHERLRIFTRFELRPIPQNVEICQDVFLLLQALYLLLLALQ